MLLLPDVDVETLANILSMKSLDSRVLKADVDRFLYAEGSADRQYQLLVERMALASLAHDAGGTGTAGIMRDGTAKTVPAIQASAGYNFEAEREDVEEHVAMIIRPLPKFDTLKRWQTKLGQALVAQRSRPAR